MAYTQQLRSAHPRLENPPAVDACQGRRGHGRGDIGRRPRTVDVVRRFATIPVDDGAPVEDDADGMLAQFGSFNFRGTPEFSADLTRQLIEAGDEDAPIWQLQCTFYCDRTPATDALADATLWSFGVSIDEFFTQAITLPGWAYALDGSHAPRELAVTLEEV
jgi:hypothetical protein